MSKGLAAWEVSPDCHAAAAPSVCGQEMRPDKSRRSGQEKQRPRLPGYCHWGKSRGVGEIWGRGGAVTWMMRGTRKGRRAGMGCGDKQKKKGWGGSHCHANWCSAQTPVSRKRKSRGKSETREILASSFVRGGYCKLLWAMLWLGGLFFFFFFFFFFPLFEDA